MLLIFVLIYFDLSVLGLPEERFTWTGSKREIWKQQKQYSTNIMDLTVKPCKDFTRFSCGNWESVIEIPDEKLQYGAFDIMQQNVRSYLNQSLADKIFFSNFSENDIVQQAKKYYDSCMNIDLLQQRGNSPLLTILSNLGNCPALDRNWNESSSDWIKLLAYLRLYDESYLFDIIVDVDFSNSSTSAIYIDQPTLYKKDLNDYKDGGDLGNYRDTLVKTLLRLGADLRTAENVALEVIEFETKLAIISENQNERGHRMEVYSKMTINELQKSYPGIKWWKYFSILLNRTIEGTETFNVDRNYLKGLIKIITNVNASTIQNYAIVRFAISKMGLLLDETKNICNWWMNCVDHVMLNMDTAVSLILSRKYMKGKTRNDVNQIVERITKKYREVLQNNTWLDGDTRRNAINKLDRIHVQVGAPKAMKRQSGRKWLFNNIDLDKGEFFESSLKLMKLNSELEFYKFFDIDKTIGLSDSVAHYDFCTNRVSIGVGLLQPPYYKPSFPAYQKFGIIGFIIAHEISHAFDRNGRHFDLSGSAKNWWSNNSEIEYKKRQDCFVKQYKKLGVNGVYTYSENIADNIGLKISFLAYVDWVKENSQNDKVMKRETLKGLKLNGKQLFFVSFAQWQCEEDYLGTIISRPYDPHPPKKIRIRGSLANSWDFAMQFNCKNNTKRNPEEKCELF